MRHHESDLQSACVSWFRWQHPTLAPLLFAVPNGGHRSKVTAAILKREGATAGVADLILLTPGTGAHTLCIEMKADKGRQTEAQRDWQSAAEAAGNRYVVCRTLEEFIAAINTHLHG